MNWDTRETIQWVNSTPEYLDALKQWINNEMLFIVQLVTIIQHVNSQLDGNGITLENVNGNEVFIDVNDIFENETKGWCGNEDE